jgi:uncharacterized PurR-regulated membrane protein YhhQ (DUF165 family)
MQHMFKLKYTLLYLAAILLVSVLFTHYPAIIALGDNIAFTPWTLLVGTWFVLRDYSQREIGHWVFVPMVIGVMISFLIDPAYGLATCTAMLVSETLDWVIYTLTKRPFHQRVVISSIISVFIDAIVFYWAFDFFEVIPGVEIFNWVTILLASLSKSVAAVVVYLGYRHRYRATT